ncbi:MAG TPA: hypothetical protein VFE45_06100 [Coriobacteriia bacterium]|nr:hypothetical protein [Coriobacteriia bacterium]
MTVQVEVTGTWLPSEGTTESTPVLLIGTVLTDQPHFRWLAGVDGGSCSGFFRSGQSPTKPDSRRRCRQQPGDPGPKMS